MVLANRVAKAFLERGNIVSTRDKKTRKNVELPKPPAELVNYYKKLSDYVTTQTNNLKLVTINKIEGVEEYLNKINKESSLLEEGFISLDNQQIADNFKKLVELLKETSNDNPLVAGLETAIDSGQFAAEFWGKPIEEIEESLIKFSEEKQVEIQSLLQLAYWSMSPYWRLVAGQYNELIHELKTNTRNTCPVCGKFADSAYLDDDKHGRRYLVCLQCDVSWPYHRTGCVYCDNKDFEKLGYILIDDIDGYKIYHCEECKTYLKTYDRRADTVPLGENRIMEDINTMFMDMLAIEKGYSSIR